MRRATLGPLDVIVGGGTDGNGGGEGPVVVLLHGFGAPGDDLVPLGMALDVPETVRWVFPAAPLTLSGMGFGMESRAWWIIDMIALERAMQQGALRDLSGSIPEGLPEARTAVLEMLDALESEFAPTSLTLGGFSQGAMLALDVALHTERTLAGLVLMSGTLLGESEWVPRMAARRGVPVVLSHGKADPLLPFAMAEQLRDRLVEAGLEVDFQPFQGGHEIPQGVMASVQRQLSTLG